MDCRELRQHLLDYQRGRLNPELEEKVRAHIEECTSCSRAGATERALTDLLERKLPQYPAPISLKLRLAAQWPSTSVTRPSWWERWGRSLVPAGAFVLILLLLLPWYYERTAARQASENMVTEAVNNHLRILQSQHPLEIESGNFHQVKPWFAGRLDFAPVVLFLGDEEFPLRGGAIGYYLDRKAAVFEYGSRLHTISLFVFRAEGLPWSAHVLETVGNVRAYSGARRGYNVILWRGGELGYAMVSDVDSSALRKLVVKLSGGA